MSIEIAFLIETAVAVAILRWLWGRKNGEKLSRKTILAIVFLSIPAIITDMLITVPIMDNVISQGLAPLLIGFFEAFVAAGTCEELIKFALLFLIVRREPKIASHLDVVLAALMIAMGFTLFENYSYLGTLGPNTVTRIFTPGHLLFGFIMGYYYGKARVTGKIKHYLQSLALPILMHGIFDLPAGMKYMPKDKETIDALTSLPYETDKLILNVGGDIIFGVCTLATIYAFWKIYQWSRNGELQESIRT